MTKPTKQPKKTLKQLSVEFARASKHCEKMKAAYMDAIAVERTSREALIAASIRVANS